MKASKNNITVTHQFYDQRLAAAAAIARRYGMRMEDPTAEELAAADALKKNEPVVTDEAKKIADLETKLATAKQEAAANRRSKDDAVKTAKTEVATLLAEALGITTDETDPKKLAEKLSIATAQSRQAAIELAVFRVADAAGGNASALLDSRSFLAKVAELEATDTAALSAAVELAVQENPLLAKAGTDATATGDATKRPGLGFIRPDLSQGSGGNQRIVITPEDAFVEWWKATGR